MTKKRKAATSKTSSKVTKKKVIPLSKTKSPKKLTKSGKQARATSVKSKSVRKTPATKKKLPKNAKNSQRLKSLGELRIRKATSEKALPYSEGSDLPYSYGKTKIVLLVRDPEWGYAYWDFSGETWNWIQEFAKKDPGVKAKLRVYNLSQESFFDVDIHLDAKNWYVHFKSPNIFFEVELGLVDSRGVFHSIARSNRIQTPRDMPSDKIDPNWNPEEIGWDEMFRLSGGAMTGRGSSDLFSPTKRG